MAPRKRSRHKKSAAVNSKYFSRTAMDSLPDDILLEVFHQYRLINAGDWPRLQGWYKLAHTCRRWRQLVFASSLRLNLQLRCTFGTQVTDMIAHSPPFPLVLDYGPRILKTWTPEQESGLLFALRHLSRTNEIILSGPQATLVEMTAAMVDPAPVLEHLMLHSQSAEFVLPKSFLNGDAPQLRYLILTGASLATLHPLLTSATSLVSLILERIPSSVYFSPGSLVAHVRSMPHLQTLSISFLSAIPRPGFGSDRLLPPSQIARVELPALTQLGYRGVSAYLEALLARIQTPLIQDVDITLFNQLTLRLPRICRFIRDLETFGPTRARIDFAETSAHIDVSTPHPSEPLDIALGVSCTRFDFQLSAMAQICSGLAGTSTSTGTGTAALLMPIEELMLGFHQGELPQEWLDEIDPALWRGLLALFRHVRTLRIHVALAAVLGPALGPPPPPPPDTAGGLALLGAELEQQQLIPELRTVLLLHGDEEAPVLAAASEAFGAFIKARNRAGRPVNVESQNLSRLWSAPAATQSATSSLLRKKYHRPALHQITASE